MTIKNPKLLYLKAALFLAAGTLASAAILLQHPSIKVALLLAIAIWCFARAYYFAFYVIEKYADPQFRYAGLWDFAKYALNRSATASGRHPAPQASPAPLPQSSSQSAEPPPATDRSPALAQTAPDR